MEAHTSNSRTEHGRDAIVTALKRIHASYTKKEQRPTQQTRQKGWYNMNIEHIWSTRIARMQHHFYEYYVKICVGITSLVGIMMRLQYKMWTIVLVVRRWCQLETYMDGQVQNSYSRCIAS